MKMLNESLTKEELDNVSDVYDYLRPFIEKAAANTSVFNAIKKEIIKFADKNSTVLQSNIIGRQLLFNENIQQNILDIMGIDSKILDDVLRKSDYFNQYGTIKSDLKLTDQLVAALPLILLAGEYQKKKKYEQAEFIYLISFYKPYATRISRYFPYGVNDDQMLYTIENLSERFDIKKQGTMLNVLIKMAKSSFDNYIKDVMEDPTDRKLHVVFTSGVYSRINNFLQVLVNEYHKNKGKYLPFEDATFDGTDDSEGETFEKDIQSDAAIKNQMIRKAVNTMNNKPIDTKLLELAARYGFVSGKAIAGSYKFSTIYTTILKNAIEDISNKFYKELPLFFESLIGSFLYEINSSTKQKYSSKDLRSPVFVAASRKIFLSSPNTKNENVIRVRTMINEMLESCSTEYINYGTTQKRSLRNALHFYFVLLVQKG